MNKYIYKKIKNIFKKYSGDVTTPDKISTIIKRMHKDDISELLIELINDSGINNSTVRHRVVASNDIEALEFIKSAKFEGVDGKICRCRKISIALSKVVLDDLYGESYITLVNGVYHLYSRMDFLRLGTYDRSMFKYLLE